MDRYERDAFYKEDVPDLMTAAQEAEVWKIAQIAAALGAPMAAAGKSFEWSDVVKSAVALLAESRRQAAVSAGKRSDG